MSDNSLVKNSSIIALGTLVSRFSGLARSLLTIAALGTALLGDTYNVANQMPNIVYNLILGGSLASVFIPQIVRAMVDKESGSRYLSQLLSSTLFVLGSITILSIIISPLLVRIFASSYVGRPEFAITVLFMRLCLPQIFFLGVFALLGQIANAHGRFTSMAWAPAINNFVIVGVFSFYISKYGMHTHTNISHKDIVLLGVGTTAGYVIQALILIPNLWADGLLIKPTLNWANPELSKSLRLASWTFIFAAISQVSFLVTQNIATRAAVQEAAKSTVGVGITPYNNAYYVMLLPHSIITLSLVTALLPQISRYIQNGEFKKLHAEVLHVIRLVIAFVIPCSLFLFFFAQIITRSIFVGIDIKNTEYLAYVLMGFAPGLIFFSLNVIGLRVLNAFENAKKQVMSNLIMNIFAVIASIIVAFTVKSHWVVVCLAVILSLSYVIGFWTTFRLLANQGVRFHVREIYLFLYRITFISFIAVFPAWLAREFIFNKIKYFSSSHELGNIFQTIVILVIGGGTYLFFAFAIEIKELSEITKLVLGKFFPSKMRQTN